VGDDPNTAPVARIGAREGVDDVEIAVRVRRDDLLAQLVERRLVDRLVDAPPPDPVLRAGLADDELVPRRAAGVAPGVDGERPALREVAVAARERVRVQERGGRVPVDATPGGDAVLVEPALVQPGGDRHRSAPFPKRKKEIRRAPAPAAKAQSYRAAEAGQPRARGRRR